MESPKAIKMVRVAESTLKIIHQHGMDGLTHSRLARAAGVSRPWLYAYIGKDKQALIELAVSHFGKVYAQIDAPAVGTDPKTWIDGQTEGLKNALTQVVRYPWIMPIYFRYRATENELGRAIMDAEKLYVKKQMTELQNALKLDSKTARAVAELCTAFKLGLAYRWAVTSLNKDVPEDHVLVLARSWLKRTVKGT